ncbi:hypothetical protein [Halobacterium litoreum]|uniref:DUF5658 domain-containing protein n=1 Tax=Halobacterium litoreum TaxID=2039234 RepID=A0ABD5NAT6_9EURY|nr:hypothetical protein [Halobacterium litoreum]UHH14684.1 hypothetical protein LT972_06705 [Halobacterium litoreum]
MSATDALGTRTGLVALLAASKFADAATTYAGLRWVADVREANPVVAAAIHAYGVPAALLLASVLVVVAVVAVTEATILAVDRWLDPPPNADRVVRVLGYGLPAVVHVAVAARNAVVVLAT